MRLALREMRRRPGRFGVAAAILTLIALLLVFLGGLLDGLIAGSTGALRAQRGDAIVFSADSEQSLVRSRITPAVSAEVTRAAGDARVAGLGSVQLGARLEGRGPRDLVAVVLFGAEVPPRGADGRLPPDGRVLADDSLRGEGVEEGDVLRLGAARTPVEVVGFVDDTRYAGQGTLWGSLATWREVQSANRPGSRVADGVVQALVVGDGDGAAPDPAAIDEATGGATSTLTVPQAIDELPGVSQQRTVFNQIIGVTVVVALVVVALFFALITVERTALYGVLKAIGSGSGTLFAGVLLQAVVVTLIASAIAVAAALAADAAIPAGGLPFLATAERLLLSVGYLLIAALAGCAFSLRRVLRVDPATAIGGDA
jgi:putative ABC transport system permease protein